MMKSVILIAIVALTHCFGDEINPLSDKFINTINTVQSKWVAGRNFDANTPLSYLSNLVSESTSSKRKNENFRFISKRTDTTNIELPESYDAREQWKNCTSLTEISDESISGFDWAVSAVETITDRICIASNGTTNPRVSAEDVITCCYTCGYGGFDNSEKRVWFHWITDGIVSGGRFNTTTGCRAFSYPECEHTSTNGSKPSCNDLAPKNISECTFECDEGSDLDYFGDLSYGSSFYMITNGEEQIMADIYQNGPVQAAFTVYSDFFNYKSGVYHTTNPGYSIGSHFVKILGWGVENGNKYWLVANAWNEDWGDKGFFKITRGTNHCDIESNVVAGLPLLASILE